ncbi:SMP-30/gluconolactonase/LRE family protein [Segetibacter sp. 3557_3]|uniref:SMP-30/gluconolactonase/LRE family protein n=1 Tax=Segetibacter sp. 3557_3 TaxID=2547429 RepID=UPI001058CE40|nr:SMP-30/gluconolactonase/LRE family protein [Segetibacter sp. 3557_3]TDH23495.1 SMP-30/gluconolactonase/LRE family protein [Segetibacter sp. 3557_3]
MKKVIILMLFSPLMITVGAQEAKGPIGAIEFVSNELSKVINKDAKVEVIAEGFQFTEGPLWLEKQQALLFSDVPGNTIYKWTEAKGKEVYLTPGGYTGTEARGGFMGPNALSLDGKGQLLICQHGDRRIAKMDAPLNAPKPNFVTVAGEYNGKKLNSPNDFILNAAGDMYFTDPSYGLERGGRDPKKEITYQGVYKMDKAGRTTLLVDSIEQPNGIGIFPDGKTLLVSNSDNRKKRWYAYDISGDGALKNARVFYDVSNEKGMGGCDGFKIDKAGNVFASGPGGIWIFAKTGKLIGKINLNGTTAANCALTPDGKTIFITATTYLLRIKMR